MTSSWWSGGLAANPPSARCTLDDEGMRVTGPGMPGLIAWGSLAQLLCFEFEVMGVLPGTVFRLAGFWVIGHAHADWPRPGHTLLLPRQADASGILCGQDEVEHTGARVLPTGCPPPRWVTLGPGDPPASWFDQQHVDRLQAGWHAVDQVAAWFPGAFSTPDDMT